MLVQLEPPVRRLLDSPNLASLATVMEDGSPQVSSVWIVYEDDHLVFTTVEGVAKLRNIRRDPRVALTIFDHQDPYTIAAIRGVVVDVTKNKSGELLNRLARKYLGKAEYGEDRYRKKRVVVRIEPERVSLRELGYKRF